MNRLISALCGLVVIAAASSSVFAQDPVSRTEALNRAKTYTYYPWRSTASNETASCSASYRSFYAEGDHLGVAYKWGGFDTLFAFTESINDGLGAGKAAGGDVLSCTAGVDCSGLVSQAWKTPWKYGTWTLPDISSAIAVDSLLVGDIFNYAGYHTAVFSHLLASGQPYLYEAIFFNVHVNANGGWSWVEGYVPRRYEAITGTAASDLSGTLTKPITVGALPFADSNNTAIGVSDLLDGCGASPNTNESGPEIVYEIEITEPGMLTVAVSDDAGVDIDVHLYSSWNTNDCVARNDRTFTHPVDCGTYYVVADTFAGASNAGNYDLTITHAPSGADCGNGPPTYDPDGGLGDSCAFPDDETLPFCNPTLGADVCLFTSGADAESFCSRSCATSSDCAGMPDGGGCCEDIGEGELYCMTANLCASDPDDPDDPDGDPDGDPGDPSDPDGPGGSTGNDSGGCQTAPGTGAGTGLLFVLVALLWRRRRVR